MLRDSVEATRTARQSVCVIEKEGKRLVWAPKCRVLKYLSVIFETWQALANRRSSQDAIWIRRVEEESFTYY